MNFVENLMKHRKNQDHGWVPFMAGYGKGY